jgi:hypothetical protein
LGRGAEDDLEIVEKGLELLWHRSSLIDPVGAINHPR